MTLVTAFAPATVSNVACGFDVLGFPLHEPGDRVVARLAGSEVTIDAIENDGGRLPRDAARNTAGVAVMALLVVATRNTLPLLFLGRDAPDPETVALAAALLMLGASFFMADGAQTITAGALRGLNDTRVPLVFAAVSFWVVGFSACWLLGFTFGLGARGIWVGFTVGLVVYAALLITRFHRLTARHYLPQIVTTAPS